MVPSLTFLPERDLYLASKIRISKKKIYNMEKVDNQAILDCSTKVSSVDKDYFNPENDFSVKDKINPWIKKIYRDFEKHCQYAICDLLRISSSRNNLRVILVNVRCWWGPRLKRVETLYSPHFFEWEFAEIMKILSA